MALASADQKTFHHIFKTFAFFFSFLERDRERETYIRMEAVSPSEMRSSVSHPGCALAYGHLVHLLCSIQWWSELFLKDADVLHFHSGSFHVMVCMRHTAPLHSLPASQLNRVTVMSNVLALALTLTEWKHNGGCRQSCSCSRLLYHLWEQNRKRQHKASSGERQTRITATIDRSIWVVT